MLNSDSVQIQFVGTRLRLSAKSSCLVLCEPHWVSEQRSTTESGCARPLHGLHESAPLAVEDTLGSSKGCFNCIICLTGLIGIRSQSRAHDGYSVQSQLLGRYPSRTHRTHQTCRIGDVRQRRTKPGKTYPFSIRQDVQKKWSAGNGTAAVHRQLPSHLSCFQ